MCTVFGMASFDAQCSVWMVNNKTKWLKHHMIKQKWLKIHMSKQSKNIEMVETPYDQTEMVENPYEQTIQSKKATVMTAKNG